MSRSTFTSATSMYFHPTCTSSLASPQDANVPRINEHQDTLPKKRARNATISSIIVRPNACREDHSLNMSRAACILRAIQDNKAGQLLAGRRYRRERRDTTGSCIMSTVHYASQQTSWALTTRALSRSVAGRRFTGESWHNALRWKISRYGRCAGHPANPPRIAVSLLTLRCLV